MSMKIVVVAVDLEKNCVETLSQLNNIGIPEEAEIHLVHVFEYVPNLMDLSFVLAPSQEDLAQIQMALLEKLDGVKKELGLGGNKNVRTKCMVSSNSRQEFLQYADSVAADLVIAASKERTGFIGLFEGSFTSFLTRFCRANLMILRPIPHYNVG